MLKPFPIPPGADTKSKNAILAMQAKLGNMFISDEEIKKIIDGIMRAQAPRDQKKAEEKMKKAAQKQRDFEAMQAVRRGRHA